jgi:hypothetical protein
MTEDIPEDLKPGYAPDPRSFRQILTGVVLIAMSPLFWEIGVAMDPTVVDLWRQLVPIAPFGQFFPSVLPQFMESSMRMTSLSGGGGSIGMLMAFGGPVNAGIGLLVVAHGAVWTAAESLRSARDS